MVGLLEGIVQDENMSVKDKKKKLKQVPENSSLFRQFARGLKYAIMSYNISSVHIMHTSSVLSLHKLLHV